MPIPRFRIAVGSVAALVCAVVGTAQVPAAAASGAPGASLDEGKSTPELIDESVKSGEINRSRGDLYLAYAFSDYERVPAKYRSEAPWHGTVPLLRLNQRVARMPSGPQRSEIQQLLKGPVAGNNCGSSTSALGSNIQSRTSSWSTAPSAQA